MNCPTCGKELRSLQVEKMLGNPDYNEWCRNGYCSSVCFEGREPSDEMIEPVARVSQDSKLNKELPNRIIEASKPPRAYGLATACLVSAPLTILATGLAQGAYLSQTASTVVLGLALLMLTIGFVSGIVAFVSMKTLGIRGLFWKSVIGLTMNAYLFAYFMGMFFGKLA